VSSRHEEGRLAGAGGIELYWQAWTGEAEPRAVVVIAHGASEHSSRYAHVAERVVEAGYAVYALDHRGHGRSEGKRAQLDRLNHVIADLRAFVDLVTARHAAAPVYLLGHSMGGGISIAYAVRHQETLAGLVLSAPVADPNAANALTRGLSRILSAMAPDLGVYSVDAKLVSRDPEVVRKYEQDPLVYHGKLPARTVAELTAAVAWFPEEVVGLRLPLLVMHGDADGLVPAAGSRMIHERSGSDDKTIEIWDGLYHEILNEPEQDQVLDLIVAWLDERSG
jgi:alpha-beta hydrolase superfamily lysophospholipase